MRVSIIKQRKIKNIILPEIIAGNYWISDTDKNGIKRNLMSISAYENSWKLNSNSEVYYIKDNVINDFVILNNYNFYTIRNNTDNNNLLLYCSPSKTEYNYYNINDLIQNGVTIGNSNCNINYTILGAKDAIIKQINNEIYIIDNNSKYGIYVNNVRVYGKKLIKNGDIVFIMGLKMVLYEFLENGQKTYTIGVNFLPNVEINLINTNININGNVEFHEDEIEVEYPLYDESQYFHKNPRFVYTIDPLNLQIDPPPGKIEEQQNNFLLTVGPMLTMSMTSMVTGYTAIASVSNGTSTWGRAIPSLIMCTAMFATIFIWPFITRTYEKKMRIKKEHERQEKYNKYIEEKRLLITEAKKNQTSILLNNYPDTKYAYDTIMQNFTSLWQKRIEDKDFMEVNLGIGNYPMKININYPEEHFSMVEDNLKDILNKLGSEPKMLSNVPVPYSFYENYINGILGNEHIRGVYMRNLLLQLLAAHSYDNLKIVVLTDEENEYQWKFLKNVPHCFTNDKKLRFFATSNDEYKEVCYFLEQVYLSRVSNIKTNPDDINNYDCIYMIITDTIKKVKDFDIINSILESNNNYGFTLTILDDKIINLPDHCISFIQLNNGEGELRKVVKVEEPIKFTIDQTQDFDYELISQKLSNVPIDINDTIEGQMPTKLGFLELFDVGKIEQLNSLVRWKESNPMLNLQVPVGIGKNGEKINIDLHEKYHGPHGLIAGMTGSGKSEFIITYILSLAINFHPYEVQFILIDYKGGGLAGAFENKTTGLKLPHLVGTITNLDTNEIKRSLASIESELKRRQELFNKARDITNESTIDIYKYQKMYRDKIVDTPVSHLFIICDEFAELKTQQSEFMTQLISAARIGRSLGIHLILATQKPSGVVDPQIWSNTRFRICLRVQDKNDSNEVIKCPDAAYLNTTGRFYFQVGYNEYFTIGQSAWTGNKYIPSEKVTKSLNTSIDFINNIGYIIKSEETKEKKEEIKENLGEELINIVKYLDNIAKEESIKCIPLWLEKIPEDIRPENLAKKYNYKKEDHILNPIIGEYDIPTKQEQKLLTLPLSKEGNAIIYGATNSGKENFITTLISSCMDYYSTSEVNFYIIDFGTETLKYFKKCNMVGNILNSYDTEDIINLYKMLNSIIAERKKLFADYNGDYYTYCKTTGNKIPNIVVIINNFESYQETMGDLDDTLIMITRECNRYGIYFVITTNTPNGVRFKLKQNFVLIYALQQNNDEDYSTILGNVHKNYPSKLFGRGLVRIDEIYEFQTASVTMKDHIPRFIKEKCEKYNKQYPIKALEVPKLPEVVGFKEISKEYIKDNKMIIGIDKNTFDIVKFDFRKNYTTIITGNDTALFDKFINPFINQLISYNTDNIFVINSLDIVFQNQYKRFYNYIDDDFNTIFTNLYNYVEKLHQMYVNANYSKKIFTNVKYVTCIICGIEDFKNKLSEENKKLFSELFNKAKDLSQISFIIVDTIDRVKKIELEQWFKNCVDTSCGIWLGNGINDQFTLKIAQRIPEIKLDVPNGFAFILNKGKTQYIKYVEKFELKINKN